MAFDKVLCEAEILNKYISLVSNYEIINIKHWIIKNYALTNSIPGVIRNSLNVGLKFDDQVVTKEMIVAVIKSNPEDELHKIIRKGYLKKIRRKRY